MSRVGVGQLIKDSSRKHFILIRSLLRWLILFKELGRHLDIYMPRLGGHKLHLVLILSKYLLIKLQLLLKE